MNQVPLIHFDKAERIELSVCVLKQNGWGENSPRIVDNSVISTISIEKEKKRKAKMNKKKFRSLTVYPLFDDFRLAEFSVNYWLYFEFYRCFIHIQLGMMLYALITSYIITNYLKIVTNVLAQINMTDDVTNTYKASSILVGGVILRILRVYNERNIKNSRNLQQLPWTESFFSLLLENIPLTWSETDIKNNLQEILKQKGDTGFVQDVIQIQDYYGYYQLKNQVKQIDQNLSQKLVRVSTRVVLIKMKAEIQDEISRIEESLLRFEHYKSKAIIIFSTMQTKRLIKQHYALPWYRFGGYFSSEIQTERLSEPQDIIYGNLCFSKQKRLVMRMLGYALGVPIAVASFCALFEIIKIIIENMQDSVLNSMISILTIQILYVIVINVYRWFYSFIPFTSNLEASINCQYNIIYTKTVFYLGLQYIVASIYTDNFKWYIHLLITTFVFVIEIIILKLFKIASLMEFNLTEGIAHVTPLLLFAFAFCFNFYLSILTIVFISLYIMVLIDKYRLIKYSEPALLKSPDALLRLFGAFKFDQVFFLYGGLAYLVYHAKKYSASTSTDSGLSVIASTIMNHYYIVAGIYIVIFTILPWILKPQTLRNEVMIKFVSRNLACNYDSVCDQFASTYREYDLYSQLKKRMNSSSDNLVL